MSIGVAVGGEEVRGMIIVSKRAIQDGLLLCSGAENNIRLSRAPQIWGKGTSSAWCRSRA